MPEASGIFVVTEMVTITRFRGRQGVANSLTRSVRTAGQASFNTKMTRRRPSGDNFLINHGVRGSETILMISLRRRSSRTDEEERKT